ncbi:uncharacterized protein LOC118196329 [Stegodyphus dumicola]|uniref:uncharacterized protein LOC118196329 n=1 Tax=Stegodyphus dumicola TaxID=202533 RepID=UPI0015AA1E37|nr:uncharacterized protein LOC118196329 [Stegodyphus dumicola]
MKLVGITILAAVLCVLAFGDDFWGDNDTIIYEEETTTADPFSTTTVPTVNLCSGIPCGYAIFEASTIVLESFVKNNCECETGTRCYLNALQGATYVYHCSQFWNETDPILNQVSVPVQFPSQSGSRILRRISMINNDE